MQNNRKCFHLAPSFNCFNFNCKLLQFLQCWPINICRILLGRLIITTARNYLPGRHQDLHLKHIREGRGDSCAHLQLLSCVPFQTTNLHWQIPTHAEVLTPDKCGFWSQILGTGNNIIHSIELILLWSICRSFTTVSSWRCVFMVCVQAGRKK